MSADDGDGGPGRREVARRVFAAEYDDADFSYSESEEERAPNYVVTPTGARANRLFVVGVLTEIETVNEDVLRARIVDPTGAFVVYAGQYQPEAVTALERIDPPAFVAVTGKARTFQPEDSEQVYTSVRPESISEVDAETRDRWTVRTAEHTVARVAAFADALDRPERGDGLRDALQTAGVEESLAAGIPLAIEHYGTTPAYLAAVRELALDAARVVAGEREEVAPLSVAPEEGGDVAVPTAVPEGGAAALLGDRAPEPRADAEPVAAEAAATPDATATDAETPADGTPEEAGASTATETASADDGSGGDEEPSETVDSDFPEGEAAESDEGDAEADPGSEGATRGAVDETVADSGDTAGGGEPVDPGEAEMYELDDDEREELESEYGAEFASGTEIPDAGEADIETPDPEELAETAEQATDAGSTAETAGEGAGAGGEPETTGDEGDADSAERSDESLSGDALEDAVVEEMRTLGDGDGAGREELVEAVVDAHGVEAAAVEDAIQSALMSGRCYESGDDELTPI
jgi:RPA family protein